MKFGRHPLSAAWPDMAREDFDALVLSIETNGLRDPITLMDGQILDGWHRYQACEAAGVNGAFVTFGGTVEAAEALVNDRHTRRSLTASQRAMAVLKMYEWRTRAGQPKKNSLPNSELTAKQIAVKAGVSVGTVGKVKEALALAPDRAAEIKSGKVSASTVVRDAAPAKAKPEAPVMVTAEVHAALNDSYDQLADRAKDMATELESYADVKDGDAAKALIQARTTLRAVESRRDELMRECAEHVKTIKYWKNRAERFAKEIENMKATAL